RAADPAANPFRFGGEYTNTENGTDYTPARLYHRSTGRFTTRDPHPTPLNKYQAFNANPAEYTDPTGNLPFGIKIRGTRHAKAARVKHNAKLERQRVAMGDKSYYARGQANASNSSLGKSGVEKLEIEFFSHPGAIEKYREGRAYADYFLSEEFSRSTIGRVEPGAGDAAHYFETTATDESFPARAAQAGLAPSVRRVDIANPGPVLEEIMVARELTERAAKIATVRDPAMLDVISDQSYMILGAQAQKAHEYLTALGRYNSRRMNEKLGAPVVTDLWSPMYGEASYSLTVAYQNMADGTRKTLITDHYFGPLKEGWELPS
uniref:RHS repeat-associated core domain-containing protein n=1 Tax=Streptomyces sp. NRRL F-2664 TaxID=1463842 RepID=UPI0005BC2FCB